MKKTIGGERLGSGNKMQVELHGYERSTHDLGYLWRSTMAVGTLVPCICEVALPGDTWDINIDGKTLTHPTVGPLFGSMKQQVDIFVAPIRLYNAQLHNNSLNIGMKMSDIKLPTITLTANGNTISPTPSPAKLDTSQINPSCILAYLGIRGVGYNWNNGSNANRTFNAVPLLAYWEIYKQYYANKSEVNGYVIHTPINTGSNTATVVQLVHQGVGTTIPKQPASPTILATTLGDTLTITYTGNTQTPETLIVRTKEWGDRPISELVTGPFSVTATGTMKATFWFTKWGATTLMDWRFKTGNDLQNTTPILQTFPIAEIDTMRKNILSNWSTTAFSVNAQLLQPYMYLLQSTGSTAQTTSSQEGLGIKTYQSDVFNNWIKTDWIDGTTGINQITAVSTAQGYFTIDTLTLSRKVYDMLNRIAVSGGSYDDWLDVVWGEERHRRIESPMYMGGLSKEIVFEEVISTNVGQEQGEQSQLGQLGGRGKLSQKHKGGHVVIKVDEPSYIIGIVSITPRLDYSQGNRWDTHLATMDDLHKPPLDQIGFQELITEQMAWWDTHYNTTSAKWVTKSAGKQPAWINYMTNHNRTFGNFATAEEIWMTLNRLYQSDGQGNIKDLTTYVDPVKFNYAFAQKDITAQNFWVQLAIDITARRKMSAKIMPNL